MSEPPPGDEQQRRVEEQLRELLQRANLAFSQGTPAPGGTLNHESSPPAAAAAEDRLAAIRAFNLKPRDIRDHLDRFVVRQDEAKRVLGVAICDHYNHVRRCLERPALRESEYAKHNILLLGPTGVGKTYLMRCIARLIGVPFVKADATKFSETGYVGHDVEELARDLVKAAGGDVELAQYGIIYLDEIDKIAAQPTAGKDVSGRGVQINLLKLMEETDVSLFSQTDLIGQMQAMMEMQRGGGSGPRTINTRHMLFIVSGAFDKLAELVRHRVDASPIGFQGAREKAATDSDYLRRVETRDLIAYGFEPEFVGRLPIRVVCDALAEEDLRNILTHSEANVLEQYRADFEGYGIGFDMTKEAVAAVARRAQVEQTGARGLMTVLERVFRGFKFELPSTTVRHFEVTCETVEDPAVALLELLKRKASARREQLAHDLRAFADAFRQAHGVELAWEPGALEAAVDACIERDCTARTYTTQHLHDLEYGLNLIARNTGLARFTLTREFLQAPGVTLSQWIAASFREQAPA